MKFVTNLFWKGLIVTLPVTATLYILLSLSRKLETIFAPYAMKILGENSYLPGLGILLSIILIIFVGVLVSNFITGRVIKFFISQFENIPFIKTIYNPLKDLMSFFGGDSAQKMKNAAVVEFPHNGFDVLGLVTREDMDDDELNEFEGKVSVYIPFSYMLGGLTILVDKNKLKTIDMPVDKVFKLSLTAWIASEKN